MFDTRIEIVRDIVSEHAKSPSLKHIRDPQMLWSLASEIVRRLDLANSYWRKWEGLREPLLRSAAHCWIPITDLRQYLNLLPGPPLTVTDVTQRLRAIHEEPHVSYPNGELEQSCLEIYHAEKAQGTELPAIIGRLQEHIDREEERLRQQREAKAREYREEEQRAAIQRYHSGADCRWTSIDGSKALFCRKNGRSYRLTPARDGTWLLHRIGSPDDPGRVCGRYGTRGEASKALAVIAYQPEPGC